MNMVVLGLKGLVVLDDVVNCSDMWEEHLLCIRSLFEHFTGANLTVIVAKCDIAKVSVTFLGRIVGQDKVCPVQEKGRAVEESPPQITEGLMKFVGLVGFYCRFCKDFSLIVAPLTNLLKSSIQFV